MLYSLNPSQSINTEIIQENGCMHAQLLSRIQLFATQGSIAHQAPLSTGFSSKNTGVGCHFLLQGIETASPALQADSLPLSPQGRPKRMATNALKKKKKVLPK